jgi:CheY-like chemotaxis protein
VPATADGPGTPRALLASNMTFALPLRMTLRMTPRLDVLIVDDNRFMRAAVSRILQRSGRRCVAVPSLDAAKMTLLDHRPSFVLADFALGIRETGVDLLRWLKGQPGLQDIPCGLMTSTDRKEVQAALLAADLGVLPILEKPFGLSELELWLDQRVPRLGRTRAPSARVS